MLTGNSQEGSPKTGAVNADLEKKGGKQRVKRACPQVKQVFNKGKQIGAEIEKRASRERGRMAMCLYLKKRRNDA